MSGDMTRDAWLTAERYLQLAASQPTYIFRPDERNLLLRVGDCEPSTDIRIPHVSIIPLERRTLVDYLLSGRRVFFWLWLHNDILHCPYCLSGDVEERESAQRDVIDIDEVIVLVYRIYRCNGLNHPAESPSVFSTLHEGLRKRLPNAVQETFPAICTLSDEAIRPPYTKLISKKLHELISGFCGSPSRLGNFIGQINRYHYQRYLDMKALYYFDQAEKQGLRRAGGQRDFAIETLLQAAQSIIPFPEFNDKAGWAGESITYQWLVAKYGNEILGLASSLQGPPDQEHLQHPSEVVPDLQLQPSILNRLQTPLPMSPLPMLTTGPSSVGTQQLQLADPLLLQRVSISMQEFPSDVLLRPVQQPPAPWVPMKGKGRGGAGGTRECPRCFKETGNHVPYKGHKCPFKEPEKEAPIDLMQVYSLLCESTQGSDEGGGGSWIREH